MDRRSFGAAVTLGSAAANDHRRPSVRRRTLALVTSLATGCRRLLFTRLAREGPVQPVEGCVRRVRLPGRCDHRPCNEIRLRDAVLRRCVSTVFAAVRGVPGVDLNPDTPSLFRFGAQIRDEPAPAGVTDTSGKPRLRPGAVGRYWPGFSGSGTGLARRSMLAICRSSTTTRSYRATRWRACLW
jgi:hypothetical protein